MSKYTMFNNDVMKWAAEYDGPKFHAMICDPPYHLTNRTPDVKACSKCARVLGGNDGNPTACPRCGGDLINQRSQGKAGFMGKEWDGGDIAFRPETWAALSKHLLPGAFGMAFASSRGWHRMACAIEDAGLIIHPSFFLYAFGSGFPKATRIDDKIDAAAGAQQKVTGKRRVGVSSNGRADKSNFMASATEESKWKPITQPATELAKQWAGHRYGLQAIKPAVEPLILFQKPYDGRPIDSITSTGAGALNIDAGRISTAELAVQTGHSAEHGGQIYNKRNGGYENFSGSGATNPQGRWPANFLLLDEDAARRLDQQSGALSSGGNGLPHSRENGVMNLGFRNHTREGFQDSGGASRFFYTVQEQIDTADPVYYCAKPDRSERDAGLDHLEKQTRNRVNPGGIEHDPKWAPVEARNIHPTVKPISLCKYLAGLLAPPDAYAPRRILIPFAGVMSEAIGSMLAGWEEIIAIEAEAEYCRIGQARMEYWREKGIGSLFVDREEPEAEPEQVSLFER